MSDAYNLIVSKCDQVASRDANLRPVIQKLKSEGQTLSLNEILQFKVGDNPYLLTFQYLLVFVTYLKEAPKGTSHTTVSQHYTYALNLIPQDCKAVVGSFITDIYYSALAKEIETENIVELYEWIGVYGALKQQSLDVQAFDDSLAIRLSDYIWNNIEDDNPNINTCTQLVKLIVYAQYCGLDASDTASLIISTLSCYLTLKYEIFKGGHNYNEREISLLVGQLKLLNTGSESDAGEVKILEDYFGSLVEQENPSPRKHKNEGFVRDPSLPYNGINFDQLVAKEQIFANPKHPSFNVTIKRYVCPQNGDIAVKTYEIKNPNYDTKRIINEIDILETLSKQSAPNNSFLKYIGSLSENNRIHLAMEYHPLSLMDVISEMKKKKMRFSEDEMIQHATDLISAFSTMHQMKIYHQDIKPHNILMTNYKKLKIIDFSVSESKSHDENTISPTGVHPIQGTYGYMAPEIQEHAYNDNREKVRYKLDKADVFSLGITLLQMYNLEVLHSLNEEKNHHKLIEKVNEVRWPWLCSLLNEMLKLKHKERLSLRRCLKMLPGRNTTTFHQN